VITLAVVVSLPACRKPAALAPPVSPAPTSPRQEAREKVDLAPKAEAKIAPTDPLCHGRPRCSVADRRSVGDPDAGTVVTVRLAHPADAANDEDRCDRREYWLSRPAGDLLLAVDCEAQWGAENTGPASLTVAGNLAKFRYVEFLANDACEIVDAALRLPQGRIEAHTRHWGTVVGNQCRPSRKVAPIPAPGSGTLDHPVLVLHRP
jgi:hypothetical protein